MLSRIAFVLFAGTSLLAQQIEGPITPKKEPADPPQLHSAVATPEGKKITVLAGTKVPLVLKQGISTKNAKVGDHVYLQTNFPLVQDGRMVIPEGTYVQGEITNVQRAGRVKGRAEVMMHFSTLIFPNGYTVTLPGAVDNVPGAEGGEVKSSEGKIEHEGEKGRDIGRAAGTTVTGTAIGAAAAGAKGAGIGAAAGGVTGLALALLTRGSDVRLDAGTAVEMVFQRDVALEESRLERTRGYRY
jgi:type IV secretory pathway VirB10-like protein